MSKNIFSHSISKEQSMNHIYMKKIITSLKVFAISILLLMGQVVVAQGRIQSAIGNTGTNASISFTVTLASPPQKGSTLIAVISGRTTTTNNVSGLVLSGGGTTTWTRAVSVSANNTNNTEIWYTTALSASAGTTVTITQGSTRAAAVIMEYDNLLYGAPLDRIASANGNNSTVSTGTTATTTAANELWIGAASLRSSAYTLGAITNSFTEIDNAASTSGTSDSNAKVYALERVVNSTGAASTGGTVSSSSRWSGAIATFKQVTIPSFSPMFACAGSATSVIINGSGFTGATALKFNGVNASSYTVNSSTKITAVLPNNATSGLISVTLSSGATAYSIDPFLVKSPPIAEADVTKTTCPSATDGSVIPNNIPHAINFNPAQNQYIELGSNHLNNLQTFTLEGWIKTTNYSRNSFFGQNDAIEMGFTSSGYIELWTGGVGNVITTSSVYPTDGGWHHVAGVGTGNTLSIYIDGIEVATITHNALPASTKYGESNYTSKIGGYVWDATTPNYFNGQMLKVGFWNRALTISEIADLAASPHGYKATELGLIAGYNFYEGAGSTLSKTPSGTPNGTFKGSPLSAWSDVFTYSWSKTTGGFTASTKSIAGVGIGTYNLAATFNGCTSNSSGFEVTSTNTESTAPTSITGTSPVCSGSQVALSLVDGVLGTSGAWKWYSGACGTNPISTGLSNGGRTLTVSPTATTTYFARAEGACNTTACVSFTVTVNTAGTWLGYTTVWNYAPNWCGGIPNASTDVVIPETPFGGYQPTVDALGAVCKSLTINSGATVTMGGAYAFNLHGNIINNGSFVPANSTFSFKSSGAVTGSSTTSFHHLIIDALQTLTASSATMNVTGNWTNNGSFVNNNGTVVFLGTTSQEIKGNNTFNNLTINNTSGVVGKNNITVNAVLNLASASPNETAGSLEMTIAYGNYSNILTPDESKVTTKTQTHDILNSNILYMGSDATTIGVGDVTGKVKRNTINNNTEYSFGNPNTSITFNKNSTGILPDSIMFVITKGADRGIHANKTNAVKRLYQMIRAGGVAPTSYTMKMHYLDSELNGLDESKLVLWDHHVPYITVNTPHNHGKSAQNTTDNWVQLTGHGIKYIDDNKDEEIGKSTKYWMFAEPTTADLAGKLWIGAKDDDWNKSENWTGGIPTCADNVIVPDMGSGYYPTLPSAPAAAAKAKSIEIVPGGILNGGEGGQLTICGGIASNGGLSSWTNNGEFTPGTSTVTFNFVRQLIGGVDDQTATINGTTNFHNITVAAGTYLVLQPGSSTGVSNTFTQIGNLDARTFSNTFAYNGAAPQTVVKPSSGGYNNLVLSGAGTKTLPAESLSVSGDLTLNSAFVTTSNTIVFDGITPQTLSGSSTSALNSITMNNAAGLTLGKNQTLLGTLALTDGLVNTGSNVLTVNCGGDIAGQSVSSYIDGKLAREYCGVGSKVYPIGKGGNYRPLMLAYTTFSGSSSTIQAEQFESLIPGTIPNDNTPQADRYWNLLETAGTGDGNYIIALDGTPFTPEASPKIIRINGTINTAYDANLATTTFTSTNDITDNIFGNFAVASECLPPVITSAPVDKTVCELNGTSTFIVVPEAGTYTYSWEVNTGSGWTVISNGGVYSTETTATLTITNPPYSMNGYEFRSNVIRGCGGTATSAAAKLTVNPQPQGSLSGTNNICKGTEGFLTWTSTVGTGPFTVVYNPGNVIVTNVVSGTPFSVGNISTNTTFTLVSVANASCTRTADFTTGSADVTINPYITWTGTVDRDWNTIGNWCGGIPTTNDDVLIPVVPNKPLISNLPDATTKSLIIENGSLVEISGAFKLDISANLTNNASLIVDNGTLSIVGYLENNGIIYTKNTIPLRESYGGTIELNGSSAQTLYAATYNNIVINNAVRVSMPIAAVVNVLGTFEVKSDAKMEIDAECTLIASNVLNNAGSSGILIKASEDKANGSLLFNNSEANPVQASVQMYSPASINSTGSPTIYYWQYFGIPFRHLGRLDQNFYGAYVRRYNEAGVGASSSTPLLERLWIQLQNQDTMSPIKGYELTQGAPKTYTFAGELFNSDIDSTLNYTPRVPSVPNSYPGQHILSNPYTAAIDVRKIDFGENMDKAVYIYNTGSYGQWGNQNITTSGFGKSPGQYISLPLETAGTAGVPYEIPSMQGFLVRTNVQDTGSIYINYNTVKIKNTTAQRAPKEPLSWIRLNLLSAKAGGDVMWLFSNSKTTRGNDNGWDGIKFGSPAGTPTLYSKNETGSYQINALPDINETSIAFRPGTLDTEYSITFDNENIERDYGQAYFVDNLTGNVVNVTKSGTKYNFIATDQSVSERFKIITKLSPTDPITADQNKVKVFSNRNTLYVDNGSNQPCIVEVYDQLGRLLSKYQCDASVLKAINTSLNEGVYIVRSVGVEVHSTVVIIQ